MTFHRAYLPAAFLLGSALGSLCPAQNTVRHSPPGERGRTVSLDAPTSTISPGNWSQSAEFAVTPPRNSGPATLGGLLALSGDTLVVTEGGSRPAQTGIDVFLKSAQRWERTPPVATLKLPFPTSAYSIAIDGDTVVVGVSAEYGEGCACAYVFVKPASGWADIEPIATLTSSVSDPDFGVSVSISGNVIAVGDGAVDTIVSGPGAVYVFVKPEAGWANMSQTAILTASDGANGDDLGTSVSIHGNVITAGAPQPYIGGSGKAYVFVEPSAGWGDMTQTAELTVPNALPGSYIGFSISTDGNAVLAGAPENDTTYLFEESSSRWTNTGPTATLSPADGAVSSFFGESVAISGKLAIVGAPYRGIFPNFKAGGVYIFNEPPGGWQNMSSSTVLTGSDAHSNSYFGQHVGLSNEALATSGGHWGGYSSAYVFGMQ